MIDSLLQESFAHDHNFEALTIGEIGDLLFMEKDENDEGTAASHAESIQKCNELFCLLLQQLEIENLEDFTNRTLMDLRQREQKTELISRVSAEATRAASTSDGFANPTEFNSSPASEPFSAPQAQEDWPRLGEEHQANESKEYEPKEYEEDELPQNSVSDFFLGEENPEAEIEDEDDITPLHGFTPIPEPVESHGLKDELFSEKTPSPAPANLVESEDHDLAELNAALDSFASEHTNDQQTSNTASIQTPGWFETKEKPVGQWETPKNVESSDTAQAEVAPPKQELLPLPQTADEISQTMISPLVCEQTVSGIHPVALEDKALVDNSLPEVESSVHEQRLSDGDVQELTLRQEAFETKSFPTDIPAGPATTDLGKQYWKLAHFFRFLSLDQKFPLPQVHLDKLIAQSYCSALEAELGEQFKDILKQFWNFRDVAIRSLLDDKASSFSLHPALKSGLTEVVLNHSEWLWEKRFPESSVINSLRYLFATREFSKLKPTLMDLGVCLLFFAQEESIGDFSLIKYLRVMGLTREQWYETSFRLFRLQALSSKAMGVGSEFSAAHLSVVESDVERLFVLIQAIKTDESKTGEVEQVA